MKTAAIYARVSSDKQREENTIASQTAALVAFARAEQFEVPKEWVFEDDGYSGANLIRPGLERVRDLAAEGLIQAVLIYAPDRLSRRYAHQILLIEELARAGVETLFVRAPRGSTPEDELLVQFQGMIAEYERAQILERSRRGKRHRARQGEVSVLSGALTARDQQDSCAAADRHAQRRARSRKLRQVRLRSLSHIDAIERTRDPLLSMSRLRRLAATFRLRLRQPPGASGSSGRGCLGGNRAAARRSRTHP